MKAELVSVVVPVYKVERYLDKCIGSIVKQTYTNLEIILVDDGSPDNCPRMCDEWAEKDSRIRVIHKENGGLSDARNAALDICTGTYVVFVDSDDYIHQDCVSYLVELITENKAELAICGVWHVTEAGKQLNCFDNNDRRYVMDQRQALKEMCEGTLFGNSACAKIIPLRFFDDVRFPVGRLYEDLAIMYKLFLKMQTIVFGQRALYYYVWRDNSITKSAFSFRQLDMVTYAEEMCEEIIRHWPDLLPNTQKRLFAVYVWCWESVVVSHQRSEEITRLVGDLYTKIKQVRKGAWSEERTTQMRIFLLASYFGKTAMQLCFRIRAKLYKWIKLR